MTGSLSPRALVLCAAVSFAVGAAVVPVTEAHAQEGAKPKPTKGGAKKPVKKGPAANPAADGKGPFKKKDYPTSERLRPLVLPNSMGEVGLDLGISRSPTYGLGDPVTGAGLGASFAYGIGDVAEIGVATGLLLAPDVDWNRNFTLQGHYLAVDGKSFDFAPGLLVPINVYDNAPFGVVLDLPCRYVLSDGLFLRFGQGAVPIGLSPDFTLAIAANGGIGYQLSPKGVLFADLNAFTVLLAPDADITGLWDTLGLSIGGQYTPVREWDVGAVLNLSNTWDIDESFGFGLNLYGRYRF